MDNDIKTWLYDILQSIKEIDSFYDSKPKKYTAFLTDIKTKRAVERNIEIIGEAVNRILKKEKYFKLEHAQKIVGTRNRIAHGYDNVVENHKSKITNHKSKIRNPATQIAKGIIRSC